MFSTHSKQDSNNEGWKAMTKNLTFSDLFIFAAKRAYPYLHCCDCQQCIPNNEEVSLISGDCTTTSTVCVAG
jgi:hypothetical protein